MGKNVDPETLKDALIKVQTGILAVDYGEIVVKMDGGIPQEVESRDRRRVKIVRKPAT